jgi:hypothetical protein
MYISQQVSTVVCGVSLRRKQEPVSRWKEIPVQEVLFEHRVRQSNTVVEFTYTPARPGLFLIFSKGII